MRPIAAALACVAVLAGCASAGPHARREAGAAQASAERPAGAGSRTATQSDPAARQPGTQSDPVATTARRAHRRRRPGRPLAGKVVGIDPGHNGRNYSDPGYIDHLIWNGREREACDTTGTETNGGYSESRFNFNVAIRLAADLRREGARVILTRRSNSGVGPCVDERSRIIDRAHANVAIDIHADGGPAWGRGFAILEPVADGINNRVIGRSRRLGRDVLHSFRRVTGMPLSNYDGTNGVSRRNDLAGLNLTTVPKVLIECGNMRNGIDASRLVRARFQRLAARALANALTAYLR